MLKSIRHSNADGSAGPLYEQTLDATGMSRPGSFAVYDSCSGLSVTQQPSNDSIHPGEFAVLSATIVGATSYQWYSVADRVETILTGQNSASIQVSPDTTTSYFVRGSNGICMIESAEAVVTVLACPAPNPSISVQSSMTASTTAAAVADVAPGVSVSYHWEVTNGTITSADDEATVTFRAACSGPVTVTVAPTLVQS